jgi:hypothetical protein
VSICIRVKSYITLHHIGNVCGDPPTYIKKVKTSKGDILQVPEYVSNFPLKNRAAINSAIADIFVEKGTPRNQLFISGHSCGGY